MSRVLTLFMFGLLYFVQGAAMAYFSNFQKPYLARLGIDADAIGLLTALLLLPFILKIFFGILSDRVSLFNFGHRRPFMVIGLLLAASGFFGAAWILPSQSFLSFSAFIILSSLGVALFDATTDGYAIDATEAKDYGLVQSVMVGGRAVGIISLSLIFGLVATEYGYRPVFITIGICILLPLFLVFRIQEKKKLRQESDRLRLTDFSCFFSKPLFIFYTYAVSYSLVSFGIDGLITYFLSETQELNEAALGQYGSYRGLGAVLGAALAGTLFFKLGHRVAGLLALFGLIMGGLFSSHQLGTENYLYFAVVWGFLWGFQETCFVTFAMTVAPQKLAAAAFAFFMALSNFGTALGEGLATSLVDDWGFQQVLLRLSILGILPVFSFLLMLRTSLLNSLDRKP